MILLQPTKEEIEKEVLRRIVSGSIRPIGEHVFILRCTRTPTKVEGGVRRYKMGEIYVPDRFGDLSHFGEVLAVGPKCKTVFPDDIGWMAKVDSDSHPDIRRLWPDTEIWAIKEPRIEYLCHD